MITTDWHIHSRNSCDSACMTVSDLVSGAEQKGILNFGLTDHVHTPYNLADIAKSRKEYLDNKKSENFHFGVEVSCVSKWELDEIASGNFEDPVYGIRSGGRAWCDLTIGLTPEDIEKYQIEYVIAGTHWPMYIPLEREAVIRDYHRQNMFLAAHPLVNIVAHPWWWMGHWMDENGKYLTKPWFDDFNVIPKSMHQEFTAAVFENNTAVEINILMMLFNPSYPERFALQYLEYLAELQSQGICLSIGSDCHAGQYDVDFEQAGQMLKRAGIKDNFWCID